MAVPYRVIVAGSRKINHLPTVEQAINQAFNQWMANDPDNWRKYFRPEIVSGGAQGVDHCGERYATKRGLSLKVFPANWAQYGRGAGFIRNSEMAQYADALIAIWDGESRGTAHMIKTMEALGKPVFVYQSTIS
jgi:hypothetical protein